MEFQTAQEKRPIKAEESSKIHLSLYYDPPNMELTLDEFELLSLDRLQLLRGIEQLKTRGFEAKQLSSKIQEVSCSGLFSLLLSFVPFFVSWKRNI
jgi:hypothetical protein